MPHARSKKKDLRQNQARRLENRARKSAMTTAIKNVRSAAEGGDATAMKKAVDMAYKRIDKCAKANAIHANTAARRKSLVARIANG